MKYTLPKDARRCATCTYWSGQRTITSWGKWFEFDTDTTGNCYGDNKPDVYKKAMEVCPKWQKLL